VLKEKLDLLRKKGYLFTKIETINPKKIGIKKKVEILKCIDKKSFFYFILFTNAKSRFLQKNYEEIEAIYQKSVEMCGHNFKYKKIFLNQPLCTKAKKRLIENGWEVNTNDSV